MRDVTTAGPSMAADCRNDLVRIISNGCTEQPGVAPTRRLRVELIDAFHQKYLELLTVFTSEIDGLVAHEF